MELTDLGKTPISEDSPTGSDVRYEPEFEELQAEIDKLSSVTAEGGPDWKKVVGLSSQILEQKSKDLLVAAYLAAGLLQTQGLNGLAIGFQVFANLLEGFWDNLFPPKKRMRGRRAAIEWLIDRSETVLGQMENETIEAETAEALVEHLSRIDNFLRENIEEPPSVTSIARFVEEHKAKPKEAAVQQEQTPSTAQSAPSPAPAAAPSPPEELTSPEDAKKQLKHAMQIVRQACNYLGDTNPADPLPYRLRRIAIWSLVEGLPPALDGRTKIPPPPGQITNILTNLYEEQNWEGLGKAAEARIGEFVFWMDLHFYVAQSLNFMGAQYEKAYEAICAETAYFVSRFPEIQELQFSDGTPFVSDDTRKWLGEIALSGGSGSAPESYTSAPGLQQEDDILAEEMAKAKALTKKRKLVDALSLLQDHMRKSTSARERLLWQLGLCQILIDGKKGFLALPHLDQILHNIDNYRLEDWEPELALRALKTAWLVLKNQTDPEIKKRAEDTLARIARLDATEAVRLKGKR